MDDLSYHDALAMLDWQIELGADEAILDTPVDRFALTDAPAPARQPVLAAAAPDSAPHGKAASPETPDVDAVALAQAAAGAAQDLPALHAALAGFAHCPLSQTAKSLVFADGLAGARVMIVTDAPRRDEDQQGQPLVGDEGVLFDRMMAAIGLSRRHEDRAEDRRQAVYIAPMLPWRPPQDRPPTSDEVAMLVPFLRRHIDLAAPDILVLMGNHGCQALLDQSGITRLRGQWADIMGRPALAMLHPAHLIRRPQDKALAWADLLALKARLDVRP
jgi:DNA polymerase